MDVLILNDDIENQSYEDLILGHFNMSASWLNSRFVVF